MKKLKYMIYNNPKEFRSIILVWILSIIVLMGLNYAPNTLIGEDIEFMLTIAVSVFAFIITIVNYLKIEKKSKRQSARTVRADLY